MNFMILAVEAKNDYDQSAFNQNADPLDSQIQRTASSKAPHSTTENSRTTNESAEKISLLDYSIICS